MTDPDPDEPELPALVCVVTRAADDTACEVCPAPAVVRVMLGKTLMALTRCSSHWPGLAEVLTRRGHTLMQE